MKKLNHKLLQVINRCITLIIPLFGLVSFHSCTAFMEKYGVPTAEFKVNGRVEDKLGKGISGIEISSYHRALDTTDTDGSFNFTIYETMPFEMELYAQDIDSTENGYYKTKSVYIRETKDIVITLEEEKK